MWKDLTDEEQQDFRIQLAAAEAAWLRRAMKEAAQMGQIPFDPLREEPPDAYLATESFHPADPPALTDEEKERICPSLLVGQLMWLSCALNRGAIRGFLPLRWLRRHRELALELGVLFQPRLIDDGYRSVRSLGEAYIPLSERAVKAE